MGNHELIRYEYTYTDIKRDLVRITVNELHHGKDYSSTDYAYILNE